MRKILSLFAAILFAGSMMAAVGNVYYTFAAVKNSSNTTYAKVYDVTSNGMSWSVPGNQNNDGFVRIGGNSLTSEERVVKSNEAMGAAIAKIVIAHNGKSRNDVVVDSVMLTVASDADFSADVEKKVVKAPTIEKSKAGTVEFLADEKWATGRYYKFSFFITNSSTSNGGLDVQSIAFYAFQDASAPAINAAAINFGLVPTMTLPIVKEAELEVTGANLTEVISYSVLGTSVAVTGELTANGGTLAVTLTADAEAEISDTIVLTSGTTVAKVPVEANVVNTVGDGSKDAPFTTADVVKLNNGIGNDKYWVEGYILGCAANNGLIGDKDKNVASNIAIGDAADQTENAVPVELPSGDIRTALNVVDNESNLGKKVKVHGQLISYFTFKGVKAVDEYEWSSTTAIDNTLDGTKAVKVLRDGQVLILKGEKTFNTVGQIVR